MTQYLFKGKWYPIDREDRYTMYHFARAVFDENMLTGAFRDYVDITYPIAHKLTDDMVDFGAQPVFDNVVDLFLDFCVDEFDEMVGCLAEKVRE